MIVTEQVQDAVNGEETDLGLQRMSGKTSLTPGDGHTHDDVAVVPEAALLLDGVVGERENVRRRPIPGVPNARIWSATWWEIRFCLGF